MSSISMSLLFKFQHLIFRHDIGVYRILHLHLLKHWNVTDIPKKRTPKTSLLFGRDQLLHMSLSLDILCQTKMTLYLHMCMLFQGLLSEVFQLKRSVSNIRNKTCDWTLNHLINERYCNYTDPLTRACCPTEVLQRYNKSTRMYVCVHEGRWVVHLTRTCPSAFSETETSPPDSRVHSNHLRADSRAHYIAHVSHKVKQAHAILPKLRLFPGCGLLWVT